MFFGASVMPRSHVYGRPSSTEGGEEERGRGPKKESEGVEDAGWTFGHGRGGYEKGLSRLSVQLLRYSIESFENVS